MFSDLSTGIELVDFRRVDYSTNHQLTFLHCNIAVPFQIWSCNNPIGNVHSPLCTLNGFKSRINTPPAKLDKLPCKAIPGLVEKFSKNYNEKDNNNKKIKFSKKYIKEIEKFLKDKELDEEIQKI